MEAVTPKTIATPPNPIDPAMFQQVLVGVILISGTLATAAPAVSSGSQQERRTEIQAMRATVLKDLYRIKPDTRAQIAASPGYAVFNNKNVNVLIASFGGGYGIVHDNKTGRDTYMKMGEIGFGLGMGIKDFRAVFVFHSPEVMRKFIESGWEFGGHVDAAAKTGSTGAAVSGEVFIDGITVYQLTEHGLALQATLKGTKYFKDSDLND